MGGFGFFNKDEIREVLKEVNIDEKRRGEIFSIEEFLVFLNIINIKVFFK